MKAARRSWRNENLNSKANNLEVFSKMLNSSISSSGLNRNPQNIYIYSSGYDPAPSLTSSHFSIFEIASSNLDNRIVFRSLRGVFQRPSALREEPHLTAFHGLFKYRTLIIPYNFSILRSRTTGRSKVSFSLSFLIG